MLNIKNLAINKALNQNEMAAVAGGHHPWLSLNASTSMTNKVADIDQAFGLQLGQGNAGAVTNNQVLAGDNGILYAPVKQSLAQDNYMDIWDIGNTSVS